jgi:UDP-N-acetylmuramyl pentapeptide phosphotransferase/UDP-N-acetylglucosamine-1-phosphate transferase
MLIVRYAHLHRHITGDRPSSDPQKFHTTTIPRIGVIPIFLAMLLGLPCLYVQQHLSWPSGLLLLLAAFPVLVAGLAEDVTKLVSPGWRLLAAFVSAAFGVWLLGGHIVHIEIIGIDHLLESYPLFAICFTLFAVGGVCHSMNIIDGYNGLSGGVSCIILIALGYVSWQMADTQLFITCLAAIAAIIGFLFWNYPLGLIFAGDGGAYFLGFIIAEISVLLVFRHPKVSPWFPFMLVMYPVWETVFSMYRKMVIRKHSPSIPDGLHFHMLVYKRLIRWTVGKGAAKNMRKRNSMTSPYLWGMGLLTVIPAMFFWKNTLALQVCCLLFVIMYVWLYQRIVRFKAPAWLMIHKNTD